MLVAENRSLVVYGLLFVQCDILKLVSSLAEQSSRI